MLLSSRSTSLLCSALRVIVLASLPGCRACVSDHPYVPPMPDASVVDVDAGASATVVPSAPGLVEPALVAPPATTSWRTNGMTLEAGGREIVLALTGDFDGDAQTDALAIVRPPAGERRPGSSTGELVFMHGGSGAMPAAAIASGPALGVEPSCTPTARLERIGPRSAFAEIGSACPHAAGARAVVVVRLTAPAPAVSFDAVVVDPREGAALAIDADVADRDADGIDDVVLRVAESGENAGERLTGKLAFFDRPAGPSRDPDEPDASLRKLAAEAAAKSARPKDAARALSLAKGVRALYRAMCDEGGAPRITKIHGGRAVSCGASRALEEANIAEVRAHVTLGDALAAFAAAESAELAPATKTAARAAELQKLLAAVAPAAVATSVKAIEAPVDLSPSDVPEWGPLAFEFTGKLIVRHGKSVLRVDPETGASEPADMVWRDEVVSPDGKSRWVEAYDGCDGVALRATFAPTADGDMADVVLPIAPHFGKACSGARGEAASVLPIAWGPRGLEAVVAGRPVVIKLDPPSASPLVSFTDEIPPPGSPRSHSTKAFALALSTGILVRGRGGVDRWSLVRSPDLEPYADVRRCTIDDGGTRIACVRRRGVVLATLP